MEPYNNGQPRRSAHGSRPPKGLLDLYDINRVGQPDAVDSCSDILTSIENGVSLSKETGYQNSELSPSSHRLYTVNISIRLIHVEAND